MPKDENNRPLSLIIEGVLYVSVSKVAVDPLLTVSNFSTNFDVSVWDLNNSFREAKYL